MSDWSDLEAELELWDVAGVVPTFWWRDDDAEAPTPALDRLLGLAGRHRVPVHIAVVPAGAGSGLSDRLAAEPLAFAMQHGWAHVNHEPSGRGASEIGDHRDIGLQRSDLRKGWERLREIKVPNLLDALAAPWNRISEGTVPHLPALGFRLLSTSAPRTQRCPAPGLLQVNIHVDPIRWKNGPAFRGTARSLDGIRRHLADRRLGRADRDEPTGILTHHLQTSEDVWEFLEEFFDRLSGDRIRWVRLADLIDAA